MTIIILNDFIFHESMVGKMKCLAINGEKSRNKEKTLKINQLIKFSIKNIFLKKIKTVPLFYPRS